MPLNHTLFYSLMYPAHTPAPSPGTQYYSHQGPVTIRETKTCNLPGLRALSGVQNPTERMPLLGAQTTVEVVGPAAGAGP